jgi:hypothetical protein
MAVASAPAVAGARPSGSVRQAAKAPSAPQGAQPTQAAASWHVQAPKVLAPLGPYPELKTPLPAECATPNVLAASAPAKMAERADWFWPWIVQALVAHDHAFQLVPSLAVADATTRAVHLQELSVTDNNGKSSLSLAVQCKNVATCADVARVIAAVVPNSTPVLSCAAPVGTATVRGPLSASLTAALGAAQATTAFEKEYFIPSAMPDEPLTDVGSACARLAACLRHEDEHADPALGLKCQAKPRSFPVRCAAQYTCYDVAQCANAKTSAAPVFSPFTDILGQVLSRRVRFAPGQGVPDPMGGGGIEPSSIGMCLHHDSELGTGAWAALLLGFVGSDKAPEGYYQEAQGTWAATFIEANGVAHLGPPQPVSGTLYHSMGMPGGPNQVEEFDFDNDGLSELLLPTFSVEHANSGYVAYGIWTRRGGTVEAYAPAASLPLPIASFGDEDGDGRLDLYLDSEGDLDQTGTHSSRRPDAWVLAHALKDGTFSTTDRVAKTYNASKRPPQPTP